PDRRRHLVAPDGLRLRERAAGAHAQPRGPRDVLPRLGIQEVVGHRDPDVDPLVGCRDFVHAVTVGTVNWLYNQSMGRPSNRDQRRSEILAAFERVLATHGYAGATIAAVAAEAGIAAGLVHHHFESKEELLAALLRQLTLRFRERVAGEPGDDAL